MPLVASAWAATLYGNMSAKGFIGEKVYDFCEAVATGSVMSLVGKPFNTVDQGTTIGIGNGTGVGITGVLAPVIQAQIISLCTSAGFVGQRLPDIAEAIAKSAVTGVSTATLTSNHSPVWMGSGTVIPGSILVIPPEFAANITSQGTAKGFIGSHWPIFANAIGTATAAGFAAATGNIVISGTWLNLPILPPGVPTPVPGGGSGFGTIS